MSILKRFQTAIFLLLTLTLLGGLDLQEAALARSGNSFPQTFYPNLIADVAEAVAPSVVNIDVEVKTQSVSVPGLPFGDEMLKRFFGNMEGSPFTPFHGGMTLPPQLVSGNGSGMILNEQGYILTNNHVVASSEKLTVTLNDGRKLPARLIGRDSYSDVAVLKIDAPNLKPITLGNSSKIRPGEWVIAVGSPLGFDHTVTLGIVSALSRRIPDLNSNLSFIQTDAALNQGNSGGPLVNLKGEVIGMNTVVFGRGQNIGFAIPIDMVKQIATSLIAGQNIVRPWLGISMVELNPDLAKHLGLSPSSKGVVITQVLANSPAARAGLMQGDVIERVDGKPVQKTETVQDTVRTKPLNSRISFLVSRNGRQVNLDLTTEALPDHALSNGPVKPQVTPFP